MARLKRHDFQVKTADNLEITEKCDQNNKSQE